MSLEGWLMYGDRGPIIGRWPITQLYAPRDLGPGDRVVLDNGLIREARWEEVGLVLPEGSRINGTKLEVPGWWWWLHFRERLGTPPEPENEWEPGQEYQQGEFAL